MFKRTTNIDAEFDLNEFKEKMRKAAIKYNESITNGYHHKLDEHDLSQTEFYEMDKLDIEGVNIEQVENNFGDDFGVISGERVESSVHKISLKYEPDSFVYIRQEANYNSWDDTYYEYKDMFIVEPKEVTVTKWVAK